MLYLVTGADEMFICEDERVDVLSFTLQDVQEREEEAKAELIVSNHASCVSDKDASRAGGAGEGGKGAKGERGVGGGTSTDPSL